MHKSLPVIAMVLATVALALAAISYQMLPAPSAGKGPDQAALAERLRKLERKHAELEKDYAELLARTSGGNPVADPLAAAADGTNGIAAQQEALERIARNIDKLGIIKAMEDSVREARATLMDENLADWPRIKAVDKLKALGQFGDEDVATLKQIWTDSTDFNAKGGALKSLTGHIDAGMRDEILLALQTEQQEGNPSPRFRASAVEALAPMMPDADVQLWIEHIATNDPEPRVQMFAEKFLPSDDASPAPNPAGR